MKKILVLLGPPGAGKGTVGERLADIYGLPLISSGDILRENLRNDTALGRRAKNYMQKGELVPDDLVIEMIDRKISEGTTGKGFILDGFPRTLRQAEMLDELCGREQQSETRVIYLKADDDFLINRLSKRRVCESCGKVYHLVNLPPLKEGICDSCGGGIVQRPDDSENIIRNRLDVYRKLTAPLLEYYEKRKNMHVVSGEKSLEGIIGEIKSILKW